MAPAGWKASFRIPLLYSAAMMPFALLLAFAMQSSTGNEFAVLRDQWARHLHDKQVEASIAQYAPDADFLDPGGHITHGASALRQLFQTVTATYDSNLIFLDHRVETSGSLTYDSGTYKETLTTRATGQQQDLSGTYLTIYRRGADGRWLIAEQMWSSAQPEAASASVTPPSAVPDAKTEPHPAVALTFDDMPAAAALPSGMTRTQIATQLAEELKASHLEGTYGFVNASKLENDPDAQQALRAWVAVGMNIGSHTWSHPSLTASTVEAFEQDIAKNEPALRQYAQSRDWHWFRYPFLWEGDTLEKRHAIRSYLSEHGYRIAQVSLDFEDYAWNDAYARCAAKQDNTAIDWLRQSYLDTAKEYIALGRAEQRIAFGREIPNVILLHETAFTTFMLPSLLDLLRGEGFTFASLPEVESDAAYTMDPDAPLKYGGTLPDQFMDSRHLKYPPFQPKPFKKLQTICQ